ncbi:MAG: hypothetical protein AB1486_18060 [Planctomycetota bacterium]
MKVSPSGVTLVVAVLLAAAPVAGAQRNPRIGYVYPAGGQQGTTLEVTVGGQYLEGVSEAFISGEGVRAVVIEHLDPITPEDLKKLRQSLIELRKRNLGTEGNSEQGEAEQSEPDEAADAATLIWRGINLAALNREQIADLRKKFLDLRKQPNPQIGETVRLGVTLDPLSPPGERELRLRTRSGLTNPLRFEVGLWTEHIEKEPNDRAGDAGLGTSWPVVVNGQILPGDVDRFTFTARKGEQLVAAVSARELIPYLADAVPGWFQATLALHDAQGRELAYADDYRFDPDPVLHYEIPEDGDYVLEIKDSLYRGRQDFVYRLTLGALPFVTSVFPLGGQAGVRHSLTLRGWNLSTAALELSGEGEELGVRSLSVIDNGCPSNRFPFAVDALPDLLEVEPNEATEGAQQLTLPLIVNGRIDPVGDQDIFQFVGHAGNEIIAEVQARRLDSPLDSVLVLTDDKGRELASNDDFEDKGAGLTTHQADSRLVATLPAAGTYFLRLFDAQHQGGEAYGYRLRIAAPQPDFELRVVPSAINLRAGSTAPLTVYALRKDGFAGEIALELKDPPEGLILSGGWVPAGQDKVRATLTAPARPLDEPIRLCMEGHAVIAGREIRHAAVPADDMMQAFLYRHLVPTSELLVAVSARNGRMPPLRLLPQERVMLPAGGTAEVRVLGPKGKPRRSIQLDLLEPPNGIAIQEVSFTAQGVLLILRADEGKFEPGLKGNLIVEISAQTTPESEAGGPARNRRMIPLGTLPAIPFEIVAR